MKKMVLKIKNFLFPKQMEYKSQADFFSKSVIEIFNDSSEFYDKENLVHFPHINAHGAFRYKVVKDILVNNQHIGVSDIHLSLNNIYFSKKEEQHQHNKKAAVNHLDFLAKKLQYSDSGFTRRLFEQLYSNFPENQVFDLVDYLVNPIILINVLHEFGFLESFPEFDPENKAFEFDNVLDKIKGFFSDTDTLEFLLKNYLDNGGEIPQKMQDLLNELQTDSEIYPNLPKYFKSMIFSAVESSTSFLSSLIYTIYTQYPELIGEKDTHPKLYPIANEVLRIYTPVPFIFRTVRQDTIYEGVSLREGDLVILFLGAANMDPDEFENPDRIIESRTEKHISFGRGQYACIGQFASFRITLNVMSYLAEYAKNIQFIDQDISHSIHNSMLKIPLIVRLDASKT